jgi:hypothetical protein
LRIFCSILIFFASCFGCAAYAQTGKLQVKIDILPELKDVFINSQIQIDIDDTIRRKNSFVKSNGSIVFDFLPAGTTGISLIGHGKTTGFERTYYLSVDSIDIINGSMRSITIQFPKNCEYNRRGRNNMCPQCKRSDKVLPIRYGLAIPFYDERGKIRKEPRSHPGGCDVSDCDPGWYCERNKLEF